MLSCSLLLVKFCIFCFFFFSSRRRHTRSKRDWSSDVCSSDLTAGWWGFATSSGAWLPLDVGAPLGINGLTAFCCEFDIKATLGTANGAFLSSNGQRGLSESATTAFQVGVTNLNKITVVI